MRKGKKKLIATFVDPQDCDSTIVGMVGPASLEKYHKDQPWEVYASGSLRLSDCTRTIGWDITNSKGYNIHKIDRAIDALDRIREYMILQQRKFDMLQEIAKERNAKTKAAKKRHKPTGRLP